MQTCCATPGCFKTAYDSKLCSHCLGGDTPLNRGPVTLRELWYAKGMGGVDAEITKQRLLKHGQPLNGL